MLELEARQQYLMGAALRGPTACLQLSPQVLGGTGRAGQTSLSSWTSGVEDNTRSGPGKAERHLPRDLISRAAKGTGAWCPWEMTGCLCSSLAGDTSPSTSLSQAPPELTINTVRLMPLNTSKQHAVQGFQKASLKITCTLMWAADKAKEKQRSRHPSS